jgi:hypothetical protein
MRLTDSLASTCAQVIPVLVFAALVQSGRYGRSLTRWFGVASSQLPEEIPTWIDPKLAIRELGKISESGSPMLLILRSRTFWRAARSMMRFLSRPLTLLFLGVVVFLLTLLDIGAEIICLVVLGNVHRGNPTGQAWLVFSAVVGSLAYLILFPMTADLLRLARLTNILDDDPTISSLIAAIRKIEEKLQEENQKQASSVDRVNTEVNVE